MNLASTRIVQGVLLGGLYALFAAGLSLVFGIMRLVNLAHGDLIVLAAYLILVVVSALGISPFLAALIAAPIMFALRLAAAAVVLNRMLGDDILPPLLVTFGLSVVIQNALLEGFSADSRRITAGALETASVDLGAGDAGRHAAADLRVGDRGDRWRCNGCSTAPRSAAPSAPPRTIRSTASLMGIGRAGVFAQATGIAMVVVTIAALYLGTRANFDPTIGPARLIYAFEAVIIGGLGSLWGTLAGGVIIGVAQTVGAAINPEWQILAGHVAFLAVLARAAARPVPEGVRLMAWAVHAPAHPRRSPRGDRGAVLLVRRRLRRCPPSPAAA